MFGSTIGPGEIMLVLLIALIIFGPKKLPELGQGLGRGMRDFRRALTDLDRDDDPAPDPAGQAPGPVTTLVHEPVPVPVDGRPDPRSTATD
jgi:sec-independent protein translocase protein TatA